MLAERSTLAKRTFNRICGSTGGISARSRLTVLPSVETIAMMRSAEITSFTVPRTKAVSLSKVTLFDDPVGVVALVRQGPRAALHDHRQPHGQRFADAAGAWLADEEVGQIGRASCRERA